MGTPGSLDENMEDNLCCHICLSLFKDPKALPCGHTYCKDCLHDHMTANCRYNSNREVVFECPNCRAEHVCPQSVDEFPDNFIVKNMVETLQNQKSKQTPNAHTCNICCSKPIKSTCPSCELSVCIDCLDAHSRDFPKHMVIPYKSSTIPCDAHPDRNVTQFCYHCERGICILCRYKPPHKGHQVEEAERVADTMKIRIRQMKDQLGKQTKQMEKYQSLKDQIDAAAEKELHNLRGRQTSIMKEMEQFVLNFDRKITHLQSKLHAQLRDMMPIDNNKQADVQKGITLAEELENLSDVELLSKWNHGYLELSSFYIEENFDDLSLQIEFNHVIENLHGGLSLDVGKHPQILGQLILKPKQDFDACSWVKVVRGPENTSCPQRKYISAVHEDKRIFLFEFIPSCDDEVYSTNRWNVKGVLTESSKSQYSATIEYFVNPGRDLISFMDDEHLDLMKTINMTFLEYENANVGNTWKDITASSVGTSRNIKIGVEQWMALNRKDNRIVHFQTVPDGPSLVVRHLVRIVNVIKPEKAKEFQEVLDKYFNKDIIQRCGDPVFEKLLTILYERHCHHVEPNYI